MKTFKGDLIKEKLGDLCVICITTNGFVKSNGEAVMGKGIAKQLSDKHPKAKKKLGELLTKIGNQVHILGVVDNTVVVTFPVKPVSMEVIIADDLFHVVKHMRGKFKVGDIVPGWACTANLNIIKQSVKELLELKQKIKLDFYLPKPGCGAGELKWSEVQYLFTGTDFIISDFK